MEDAPPKGAGIDLAARPDTPVAELNGIELSVPTVANMFGVTRLTLLSYAWRGAVRRRRKGWRRVYSWTDCDRIAFIIKGRRLGIPFRDLRPIVAVGPRSSKLSSQAELKCVSLIERLQSQRLDIDEMIGELEHRCMSLSAPAPGAREAPGQQRAPS
jgi:DNA-binding transcriptional MerR regulator